MPTYEYHCNICASNFDTRQKFSEAPLDLCPHGHAGVRRVIGAASIIFKGSGWYIKDSKAGNGSVAKPSSASDGKDASTEGKEKSDESAATNKAESSAKGDAKSDAPKGESNKSESNKSGKSEAA